MTPTFHGLRSPQAARFTRGYTPAPLLGEESERRNAWSPARFATAAALLLVTLLAVGCSSGRVDRRVEVAGLTGDYGVARERIQKSLADDPSDRSYILDRMRLLILTLADGQPDAAELTANEAFALLRTQGLNADKTAASVVFNERVRIWKGEPFEQALAYSYIAAQKAQRGEWDNARAAAQSSLFLLRDFGANERGERATAEDLARRAARAEARGSDGDTVIDNGYTPIKTDFALGYLLNGVANRALGRDGEASDNFEEAVAVDPALRPLADALRGGMYNTVLMVDYGRGPAKTATGPDGAIARFIPLTRGDARGLLVGVSGGLSGGVPVACDVNAMGTSLAWNNLEDVRKAKSAIGTGLLVGGAVVAAHPGGRNESSQARTNRALIGAGVAIAGLLMKGNAEADTRHCEFLAQRMYLVPIDIPRADTTVTLEVDGEPSSRIVLRALAPPADGRMQMRYVRLSPGNAAWQGAGALVYANDRTEERVPGDELPYILGGRCVRTPSAATMRRYQDAGNLTDMTSEDLANLYREEGVTFTVEDQRGTSAAHILEGGTSMVTPLAGTAGYQRLFGQEHRRYEPRSDALKRITGTR